MPTIANPRPVNVIVAVLPLPVVVCELPPEGEPFEVLDQPDEKWIAVLVFCVRTTLNLGPYPYATWFFLSVIRVRNW